jgi:hypothetical protein
MCSLLFGTPQWSQKKVFKPTLVTSDKLFAVAKRKGNSDISKSTRCLSKKL